MIEETSRWILDGGGLVRGRLQVVEYVVRGGLLGCDGRTKDRRTLVRGSETERRLLVEISP